MDARETINDLVNGGAVLEIPRKGGGESLVFLVGTMELLDEHRVFWFEANNDNLSGGHVLEFAYCKRVHSLAVGFYDVSGLFVGYLTSIREAVLPDDQEPLYYAGFATWQKTNADTVRGPRIRQFIAEIKTSLTTPETDDPDQ
ncbi:MAG: hypothetical protein PCFJNLEI_00313 [Verrucomicrobiae bacterium]|nr:hypothetical protein [Verrucomicrobiae bacterium]